MLSYRPSAKKYDYIEVQITFAKVLNYTHIFLKGLICFWSLVIIES